MYHHGFAMLALAEAYGTSTTATLACRKERPLHRGGARAGGAHRHHSQKKNSLGGWRYSPESNDADTSVSGAVLVGLLAARNAGIEIPDEAIDRAISYYQSMTAPGEQVAYSRGLGGSTNRWHAFDRDASSIRFRERKNCRLTSPRSSSSGQRLESASAGEIRGIHAVLPGPSALSGRRRGRGEMNKLLVRQLKATAAKDGSIAGQFGGPISTSLSMLALAVNYRFLPIYER